MSDKDKGSKWLSWALTWVCLFVLWVLFVGKFEKQEMLVGVIAAAIGTVASGVFDVQSLVKFRPTVREVAELWRIVGYAFSGTWEILHGLGVQLFTKRRAPSLIRTVEYDVGGDDPHASARRALAVAYTTMTPNFVVLGIVSEQRLLLYHQILPGEVLQITKNLGAKP